MINFAGGLFLALRCKQTLEPCRAFSSGGDVFRCQGLSQLHITADSRQIQQKNIFHVRAGGKIDNRLNAKLGELTAERIPVALIEFAHIIGIIIGIVTEENGPAVCVRMARKASVGKPVGRVVNLGNGSHRIQTHHTLSEGAMNHIIGFKGYGIVQTFHAAFRMLFAVMEKQCLIELVFGGCLHNQGEALFKFLVHYTSSR